MDKNNTKLKSYKFRLEIDCDNIPLITRDIPGVERSIKKPTKLLTKAEAEAIFWDTTAADKQERMPIEVWFMDENDEVVKKVRLEDD